MTKTINYRRERIWALWLIVCSSIAGCTTKAPRIDVEGFRLANYGRYYALVVGNSMYSDFPDLEAPANDAQRLASLLKTQYGFNAWALINANHSQILSGLNQFKRILTEKDNFLLYYSGHCKSNSANNPAYWLPVDAKPDSTTNWISDVQVSNILDSTKAKSVIVIAELCSHFVSGSHKVITSGQTDPVLDSGESNRSIFSEALLYVLEGNEEILESQSLYQRVAKRLEKTAASIGLEGPRYSSGIEGEDAAPFFFIPTAAANIGAGGDLLGAVVGELMWGLLEEMNYPKFPWPPPRASTRAVIPANILSRQLMRRYIYGTWTGSL